MKIQVTHFYRFHLFLPFVEIAESYAHPLINEFIFLYPKPDLYKYKYPFSFHRYLYFKILRRGQSF